MRQEKIKYRSLVFKLTMVFVGLTLINVIVFYVAAGANQIRLITEKAESRARERAVEILQSVSNGLKSGAILENVVARLAQQVDNHAPIVNNYLIVSAPNRIVAAYPKINGISLSPETELQVLRTLQAFEMRGERWQFFPDLMRYQMQIHLILPVRAGTPRILLTEFELNFLREEFGGLIRLAVAMVSVLLAVQGLLAWIIYRTLVLPVRKLSAAADEIAGGNFHKLPIPARRRDEVSSLMESFNTMSDKLSANTQTIERNLTELRKKDGMITYDLNIAQKIQSAILPQSMSFRHASARVIYQPLMTVSGDYYDFLELTDGSIAVFMADASGHGVPAAFLTIMAKVYFSSLVEKIHDPGQLLLEMNSLLSKHIQGNSLYLTAFYMRIYPDYRAEYCNCMHPEPMILRHLSGEVERLESHGFFLGILESPPMEFKTQYTSLEPGDRILLYTDGITEMANATGEQFGWRRLEAAFKSGRDSAFSDLDAALMREVADYAGEVKSADDATLMVIEIRTTRTFAQLALEKFRHANYTDALSDFNRICADGDATEVKWLFHRAECLLRLKRFHESFAAFEALRSRMPRSGTLLLKMGVCMLGMRKYEKAAAFFEKARLVSRRSAAAFAYLALVFYYLKQRAKSVEVLREAEAISPASPLVHHIKAILMRRRGE